jgi:hypothetical protein
MEEFIYQESRNLKTALWVGQKIVWPKTCRNCDLHYPETLQREICRSVMENSNVDLLKLTSKCLQEFIPTCNYCCINNFKPSFKPVLKIEEEDRNKIFHIYTETLVVEDGLVEWYDLQWEDDKEVVQVVGVDPGSFSLFDVTGV